MDYTGSISYNLSRHLADLLASIIGKTKFHVKNNSNNLMKELPEIALNEEEGVFVI